MAKISPIAAKYIITSEISIDGVVDRPDVIGAIFGQTEGLLGADLELRELQRSGRIGRIEVNVSTQSGKTEGEIIIPSSLDKTETAIVASSLEVIQRIGPCNARIEVVAIEDIRTTKRKFVVERAKELLKHLTLKTLPDSQELSDEVSQSVRMMEISEFGKDKLAAGPSITESEDIILVEGRADVLNLLKHGFKNVIAVNGTNLTQTIIDLTKTKTCTLFVDGDRGGDLIIRGLISTSELDFVSHAPDGKEVEELTKKEIHKSLRGKITVEQAKLDMGIDETGSLIEKDEIKELQDKKLPIRINDWDTIRGARVVYVHPFGFMSIVMMQTPGYHEIKEFIGALNSMYTFEKMFSIQLVKQPHYDPEDHFDILRNHWKLDRLVENIEIAQSMCLGPDEIKRT